MAFNSIKIRSHHPELGSLYGIPPSFLSAAGNLVTISYQNAGTVLAVMMNVYGNNGVRLEGWAANLTLPPDPNQIFHFGKFDCRFDADGNFCWREVP